MLAAPLTTPIAKILGAHLPEQAGLSLEEIATSLVAPPDETMGDYAFPCFRLAKALRSAPAKIANEVAQSLAASLPPLLAGAVAAGPYINLRVNTGEAAKAVAVAWASGETPDFGTKTERVMVEYSQPNTHKAFHVGHMRNLCLGDAIVRALRAVGNPVIAANYFGDVGTHISKCLWALERLRGDAAKPPEEGKGEWLGKIYADASIELAQLEDAAKADPQREPEFRAARQRMTELLRGVEERDPAIYELWQSTRQWSLDEFAEIYRWCGVHFDHLFYESDVDGPSLALVDEFLQKGVFVESEGAVGVFNEEVKHMPFFMLRKRDQTSLYSTKDLALARLKFETFAIDRSIYVVDVRQSDHFRHIFLTLKKMGFEQASRCEHVPYEMVELTTGPMAGRTGTVVLFRSLRENLMHTLIDGYFRPRYGDAWTRDEIEATAHQVALGAIKYGMLARDVNQKIIFDMPQWTKFEGNTGPYLQYVTARTASILRKAEESGKVRVDLGDPAQVARACEALEHPAERALIVAMAGLPAVVEQVAKQARPALLCTYLFTLAKTYNQFQDECHVLKSEGAVLEGRLLLVSAARHALAWGLSILGIPAPERM
jgi:arginyl-tRNA synthetase